MKGNKPSKFGENELQKNEQLVMYHEYERRAIKLYSTVALLRTYAHGRLD